MYWSWKCTDAVQKWILIQSILHLFTYTKDLQTLAQITSTPESLEITRDPSDIVTALHRGPALLHCVTSRDAVISWRYSRDNKRPSHDMVLNGDEIRKQLYNGTLYIERIDATTEGYYQCVASVDGIGTIVSRVARVRYATLSDLNLDKSNRQLSVPTDATVLLVCGVNPPYAVWRATRHTERVNSVDVQVDWIKNNNILQLDPSRMTLTPSGGLELDSVRSADNGLYKCNVTIPGTEYYKLSGDVEVTVSQDLNTPELLGSPKFIATPKSITVIEGSSVTFDCAAVGNPKPEITWLSNGVAIDLNNLDSRLYIVGEGSLRAVGVRASDAVGYTCRAANKRDSVDHTATLTVLTPPRITKSSKAVFASLRGSGTLVCEAKGRPASNMVWYKDGEPLNTNSHDLTILPPSTLRIQGVLSVDAGMFQCIVENEVGNAQAATRFIVTQDVETTQQKNKSRKKYFDIENSENINKFNPKKILKSLVSSQGENIPFEYKDINTKKSKQNVPNSQLFFNSLVSDEHIPIDELSNDYNSADFESSKRDLSSSKSDLSASKYNLSASNLTENRTYLSNHNLVLSDTDSDNSDSGEISSAFGAKNYHSDSFHAANSFEDYDLEGNSTGFDTPPMNLTAVIVKHRFATLSWEPPEGVEPSEITAYSILYHVKGSLRESLQRVQGTAREANVPGLSPGTKYIFTLRAHNQFGSSPPTDPIEVETSEESIIWGPPHNLWASAISPHSVRVVWETPSLVPNNNNPDVTSLDSPKNYQLVWSEVNHGTSPQTAWSQVSPYVIGSLRADTEYKIQVSAVDGAIAETVVKTLNDAPALPPFNVSAAPHSPNSVIVRWSAPPSRSHRGALTGYKIRYRPVGAGKKKADSVTTAADARYAVVKGLSSGTQYQFRICAINANGSGPFSEWVHSHTADTTLDESRVPSQPPPLTTRAGRDWISVWWSGEVTDSVVVRGYSLGWGLGVPDEYTVSTTNTNYVVRGLNSGAEYVISLRAINNLGPGPPVYATVRTHDDTADEQDTDEDNGFHLDDDEDDFEENEASLLIPPIGLKVIMLSGNTAVIYWTDSTLNKGQTATDGRRYAVRYAAVDVTPIKYKYFNATDLNCIVDDLKPFTTYEFAVKLYKDGRESEWSMVVTNTTMEMAPGLPPRDVTVRPDGPRTLMVKWQPPSKPNGVINGYVIMYTMDTLADWAAVTVAGDKRSHRLTSLRPTTAYQVKIQAKNSKGYGPLSPPVIATTNEEMTGAGGLESNSNQIESGVLSANGGWLWAACGGAVAVLCGAAALTAAACCKKQAPATDRSTYQKSAATAAIKPPDLWIHHDQMELKQMDKSHHSSSAASLDQASALVSSTLTLPRVGGSNCANTTMCSGNSGMCGSNAGMCGGNSGMCGGNAGMCGGTAGSCGDYESAKYHGSLDKRQYIPTYVASGSYCSEETARASPSVASSSGYSGRNNLYDCKPMSAIGSCVNYSRTPRPMMTHPEQSTPLLAGGNLGSPPSSLHSQPVQCSTASCASCSGGELYAAVSRGQYVAYEPLGHYTHRSSLSGESSAPCGSLQRRNTGPLSGTLPGMLSGTLPGNLHSFGNNSDGSVSSTPTHQGIAARGTSPYNRKNDQSSSPNRLYLGQPVESTCQELNPLTTSRSTERLNREMANLEGLMRDLTDITKNQLN